MDLETFHQYWFQFWEQEGGEHLHSHEESHSSWSHVYRHRLRSYEGGNDTVAKSVANVGHDDGDHGDEVDLRGDGLVQQALVHHQGEHWHWAKGDQHKNARKEEQPSPVKPVENIEGSDGADYLGDGGDPGGVGGWQRRAGLWVGQLF